MHRCLCPTLSVLQELFVINGQWPLSNLFHHIYPFSYPAINKGTPLPTRADWWRSLFSKNYLSGNSTPPPKFTEIRDGAPQQMTSIQPSPIHRPLSHWMVKNIIMRYIWNKPQKNLIQECIAIKLHKAVVISNGIISVIVVMYNYDVCLKFTKDHRTEKSL